MPKSPTLYRLAADRQYDCIPARIHTNPQDLQWTDRYGSTALHILCQARSVDRRLLKAVDACLQEAPDQVAWANVATWTPLHFAVEKRLIIGRDNYSTALILRLIRACPAACSLRTSGFKTKTPFHIACEADADYAVLKAMLTINPALATEPFVKKDVYSVAENPLQLLWRNHQYHNNSNNCDATRERQTKEKMKLLLRAAHCGSLQKGSFCLLNAACSVRCPRDYFTQVLKDYRDKVNQADEHGRTALHYAVQSASCDSQSYTQYVIESLLECSTASVSAVDKQGRLPLHIALSDTLMTWHKGGVRELVFNYPMALRKIDPVTALLPFMASATCANKSRLHLSTTYELLLAAPEMVQPEKLLRRRQANKEKSS